MITVDKEASIEAIRSFKDIFERFGSTRLLGFGIFSLAIWAVLGLMKEPSETILMAGLWAQGIGFAGLVVSYIIRPHDVKKLKKEAPNDKTQA